MSIPESEPKWQLTKKAVELKQGARSWCSGATERGRMEREAGLWTGDTCAPMADPCGCAAKAIM